jgi:predicted small secreted protein
MAADPLAAGLAALLGRVEAISSDLDRMRQADEAAELLRRFESMFCSIRDSAIRADREAKPNRSITQLVALTGIGRATIANARRVSRPVSYAYSDEMIRRVIDG